MPRKCIVIGTPTFGKVSLRWAFNFRAIVAPMNAMVPCIAEQGFEVAIARNRIVQKALALDPVPSHIFWLDDDVIAHPYSMLQLMQGDRDIIGGVYFTKAEYAEPLIFEEKFGGTLPYIPNSGLNRVWAVGGGLTLVKTEVYRKMLDALDLGTDDNGNPRWYYTSGDKAGETYHCNEDLWFAERAEDAGVEVWSDTSAHAFGWHYDLGADQGYPKPQWDQYLKTGSADWEIPDDIAAKLLEVA